jgi:hypothetical protein
VIPAARRARMRRWPAGLAWGLWLASLLCLAVVPWLDELLRQAGRADLVQFVFPDVAIPVLALVSSATVGAVVAARRPAHPVGWLLLGIALSLTATAASAQYFVYGLLVRPGTLPVARYAVLYQPATTFTALILIGFVLLLTPTGALPSPRWRWPARVMAVTPVVLVLVVSLVGGPVDPRYQALGGPFDLRGLDGVLLAANRTALAVTVVALVAAAASLVRRFRHARGVERLQLRWVALAAVLVGLGAVGVLFSLVVGGSAAAILFDVVGCCCLVVPPVATGAAVLRYRLYDLDRILSRTLAYGLLTLLLGGGSPLVVAGATLAVAALFQPARRRIQAAVDRRFNRRRYDVARTIEEFSTGCVIRSTSIRSPPRCWRWWTRPWSRPGSRFGFGPPRTAPRAHPAVRPSQLPGPTELVRHRRPLPTGLLGVKSARRRIVRTSSELDQSMRRAGREACQRSAPSCPCW